MEERRSCIFWLLPGRRASACAATCVGMRNEPPRWFIDVQELLGTLRCASMAALRVADRGGTLTARPRSHGGDDSGAPRRGEGERVPPLPRRRASSVAEGEQFTLQALQQGRVRENEPVTRPAGTADDPHLAHALRVYDQLGTDPPKIDIALNDAAHSRAHTIERHGPDVPLRRARRPLRRRPPRR